MASELQIIEGIQDVIQTVTTHFAADDVVINDWSILDQSADKAPYFRLETSEEWASNHAMGTTEHATYTIVGYQIHRLANRDWDTVLNEVITIRRAILDAFNTPGTGWAGGLDGVIVRRIRANGTRQDIYEPYISESQIAESTPQFISYPWAFEVETF